MSPGLRYEPTWADVLEERATEQPTALRLDRAARRLRGVGARVLPAARAVGARRARSRRRRAGGRRRCATRPTASRRRSPGLEEPLEALPARARGRRAGRAVVVRRPGRRGAARLGAGPRRAPACASGRSASRRRTSSSPCSCARSRGSATPRASTRCPTASSLWAGLFDLRENLLGRALDDLRASPIS